MRLVLEHKQQQFVQEENADAPISSEYLPGGHKEHDDVQVSEYLPAGQLKQNERESAADSVEYLPAGQPWQNVINQAPDVVE